MDTKCGFGNPSKAVERIKQPHANTDRNRFGTPGGVRHYNRTDNSSDYEKKHVTSRNHSYRPPLLPRAMHNEVRQRRNDSRNTLKNYIRYWMYGGNRRYKGVILTDLIEKVRSDEKWMMRYVEWVCSQDEVDTNRVKQTGTYKEKDEGVAKEDEGVVKKDEGVVKEDKGVVKEDEGVVKEDEGVVKEDEGVVKGFEDLVKGEEGVGKGDENPMGLVADKDVEIDKDVVDWDKVIVEGTEVVVEGDNDVVEGDKVMVEDEKAGVEGDKVMLEDEKVGVDGDKVMVGVERDKFVQEITDVDFMKDKIIELVGSYPQVFLLRQGKVYIQVLAKRVARENSPWTGTEKYQSTKMEYYVPDITPYPIQYLLMPKHIRGFCQSLLNQADGKGRNVKRDKVNEEGDSNKAGGEVNGVGDEVRNKVKAAGDEVGVDVSEAGDEMTGIGGLVVVGFDFEMGHNLAKKRYDDDTDCDSLQIALIQMSTMDSKIVLIDPLRCPQVWDETTKLKAVLESDKIIKVLHDCRLDCAMLKLYGIQPRNIFDTSEAYKFLPSPMPNGNSERISLLALTKACGWKNIPHRVENVKRSSKKRYDRYGINLWNFRPLQNVLVVYASFDVRALVPELYTYLDQNILNKDAFKLKCGEIVVKAERRRSREEEDDFFVKNL